MKALKHTMIILLALCYCLAVGGSGSANAPRVDYQEASSTGTSFIPGTPDKLAAHITQTSFVEAFAKYGQPQNFKLLFNAIAPIPQPAAHFDLQPFRQYVRKSQNMHILSVADIIFPFHSFW